MNLLNGVADHRYWIQDPGPLWYLLWAAIVLVIVGTIGTSLVNQWRAR